MKRLKFLATFFLLLTGAGYVIALACPQALALVLLAGAGIGITTSGGDTTISAQQQPDVCTASTGGSAGTGTPCSPAANDVYLACNDTGGDATWNLPACTTGLNYYVVANQAASHKCIFDPSGSDTIAGANANFTMASGMNLPASLYCSASGVWQLGPPLTYNNQGQETYQATADIAVNSTDTEIFAHTAAPFWTNPSDMQSHGTIEFTNISGALQMVKLKIANWSNNNASATCIEDVDVPATGGAGQPTAVTRSFACDTFKSPVIQFNSYSNVVYTSATAIATTTTATGTSITLPQATINVTATTNFVTPGNISLGTSVTPATVNCTGVSSGASCTGGTGICFTGCTGGTATIANGTAVTQTGVTVKFKDLSGTLPSSYIEMEVNQTY